jgi:hypothetical protein
MKRQDRNRTILERKRQDDCNNSRLVYDEALKSKLWPSIYGGHQRQMKLPLLI